MSSVLWLIIFLVAAGVLTYQSASFAVASVAITVLLFVYSALSSAGTLWLTILWLVWIAIAMVVNLAALRRLLITRRIFQLYRRLMPKLSTTEKEALATGGLGWPKHIFHGEFDWQQLHNMKPAQLTNEEQAFLDGPVQQLCSMINDWEINHVLRTVPNAIWLFMKSHGFFGLIIPKEYGGKAFSAQAHSQILAKISGASLTIASLASVPNSLGPAELLLHYGTEGQKEHYLPRLAKGEEIPCFALTSPVAGSDASSIDDYGIVCKEVIDGKEVLGMRLTWNKRYITLCPVATILGLAFKLYDPEHLLGEATELGITCALIPVTTPGVITGRRHYAMTPAFINGPTQGTDVFVSLDCIIGGIKMIGQGWRMLMECLSAGRGISIPSIATGAATAASYNTTGYVRIRRQFNTYIGKFGGVREALVKIVGYTFMSQALTRFTSMTIDEGIKPVIASAITKYFAAEIGRKVGQLSMDVHGGKALCLGPKNYIAQSMIQSYIGITVEGANILTRSLIIFGQGALRGHPYVLQELEAALNVADKASFGNFDKALFSHIGFLLSNQTKALVAGITGARHLSAPSSELKRYYQQISRFCSAFAYVVDIVLLSEGGALKSKEELSARLADVLIYLYTLVAAVKYYQDQGESEWLPLICWVCEELLFKVDRQLVNLLDNLPNRWLSRWAKWVVFPFGLHLRPPADELVNRVVDDFVVLSKARALLAVNLYKSDNTSEQLSAIDEAFKMTLATEPLYSQLSKAIRQGDIEGKSFTDYIDAALQQGMITEAQHQQLIDTEELRMAIINVDDFAAEELRE